MEAPTRYADSRGVSIAYQVHGDGPLDLVLVPGFISHVELLWENPAAARLLRRLASFSRLIVFDKRGQGLSDRPGHPPTLEESMDDLHAVLDDVGSERAAIFGVSEGGPMSTLFAATHPGRVSSLVLYGTYARMVSCEDFALGIEPEALDAWAAMMRRDWGGAVGVRVWAPSADGDAEFESWWAWLLRQGTSPAGAIGLIELYREMDVRAILPSINVPALVLHRAEDRIVSVEQARYIAERIPDSRFVELEGIDHLPWVGDQDALLDEIEEFLVGSRRTRESERALATVLFTDIVGSTERAAQLGDRRWRDLLERHDAIVRRQLAVHRGREVKTLGDGFLAVFDGPARAIRCAAAIRDELAAIGIEVRQRGGARLQHRARAGRRLGARVRRARYARAQGGAGRVAPVRGRGCAQPTRLKRQARKWKTMLVLLAERPARSARIDSCVPLISSPALKYLPTLSRRVFSSRIICSQRLTRRSSPIGGGTVAS